MTLILAPEKWPLCPIDHDALIEESPRTWLRCSVEVEAGLRACRWCGHEVAEQQALDQEKLDM